MTEFADTLEFLARTYRQNPQLKRIMLSIWLDTKDELIATIKTIGGKWIKYMPEHDSGEIAVVTLESATHPGIRLHIYRDKVCKRTVTFDCEPFLSPEDEQEVAAVLS